MSERRAATGVWAGRQPEWLVALAMLLAVLYVVTVPRAAAKLGDFPHLWVGARMVALGMSSNLYAPEAHKRALQEAGMPFEGNWSPRNDRYGAFFYPPWTALLYAPLGALPLATAATLQAVVNVGLALGLAVAIWLFLQRELSIWVIVLLLLLHPAVFFSFALGQNGILTALLVVAGWNCARSGHAFRSGLVLSLLFYKPTWLIPVAWFSVVPGHRRTLAGLAVGIVCIAAVSVATLGTHPHETYARMLPGLAALPTLPGYPLLHQYSLMALVRRLALPGALSAFVFLVALLGVVSATTALRLRHRRGVDIVWLAAVSWLAALLANVHVHHYDLVLLPCALILPFARWRHLSGPGSLLWLGLIGLTYVGLWVGEMADGVTSGALSIVGAVLAWLWVVWQFLLRPDELATSGRPRPCRENVAI